MSWQAVSLPAGGTNIRSIAYGDGKFIALSQGNNNGQVYVATDIENWQLVNSGFNCTWSDITYGDNLFVAVAGNAPGGTPRVMTSPDGLAWSQPAFSDVPTPPTNSYNWQSVTYGNGKYVAVCNNLLEGVMTSTDGMKWTMGEDCALSEVNYWESVTYANGIYVAVASFANTEAAIMYSTDAITWKRAESPSGTDNSWQGVTYGDGRFVAVGNSGVYNSMYSYDGINWRSAPGSEDNFWMDIAYGNGRFVAVSRDGGSKTMWSYTGTGLITSDLNFAAGTDMTTLATGDVVNQDATTGTVFGINGTTLDVETVSGTWLDNEDVTGPTKTITVDNAKKYLEFTGTGQVTGLLDIPQSPAYVTTEENPVLTLTFPSTFPSGFTPDEELGEGTTLTVEVTAENQAGTSGPLSATVQPEDSPPPPLNGMTTLYSGINGNQSIVTGLDLVNNDGLIWLKKRTQASDHFLFDTLRGPLETMYSNGTDQSVSVADTLTAFNDNGFAI